MSIGCFSPYQKTKKPEKPEKPRKHTKTKPSFGSRQPQRKEESPSHPILLPVSACHKKLTQANQHTKPAL
jgi:hypothetical protein